LNSAIWSSVSWSAMAAGARDLTEGVETGRERGEARMEEVGERSPAHEGGEEKRRRDPVAETDRTHATLAASAPARAGRASRSPRGKLGTESPFSC